MGDSKARPRSNSGPLFGSSQLEHHLNTDLEDLPPGLLPEPGSVIVEKYRVDRLLARGGMGAVFAATHLVSGKRVALKWMLPALGQMKGARERFVGEACATARIDHPNIVDIYDVGTDRGSVYLVMEYLRGETFSERLEREQLTEEQAIGLLMPALRGVAAAHAHGVIHRDLKPDNIFLCCTAEGDWLEPKVLDFGISKIMSEETRDHGLTRSGAVLGTPYYMSPEQVRGARDVDERADVYAFGVMLYEALTGRRPFEAETYNELILKIATDTPVRPAEINPALDPALVDIIERAMAREPSARIPTIEALAVALEPFAGGVRFRTARSLDRSGASLPGVLLSNADTTPAFVHRQRTPLPLAASNGAHKRARATVLSTVIALLLCASGLYVWHARTPMPLAKTRTTVRPRPEPEPALQAALDPQLAAAAAASTNVAELPPAAAMETTTNALEAAPPPAPIVVPDELPVVHRATKAPGRSSRPNANAVSRSSARDLRVSDDPDALNTPQPPAPALVIKRASSADWDERLPTSVVPRRASSETPAGRIDRGDFH